VRALAIVLAVAGCSSGTTPPPTSPLIVARPYESNIPKSYDPSKPTPLLLMLHGFSATPFVEDRILHITELSDAKGFLAAFPSGTSNSSKMPFWNATDGCCDREGSGVDDVTYLNAVLDDMQARYNVDKKRVYLVGHSNGGFMSHRLACDSAPRIAGIVSLAGAVWKDAAKCNPTAPVAVLQVHGTMDDLVDYEGEVDVPSAKETVATWAAKNGCDPTLSATGTTFDLDMLVGGAETRVERHACPRGAAELWTLDGGSHVPSLTPAFGEEIWKFLTTSRP
jgi:polyhydroxybutyrate depolymerase